MSLGHSLSLSFPTGEFPADGGDAFDVPSPSDVLSSTGLPGGAEEEEEEQQQDQERNEPPAPSGDDKRELPLLTDWKKNC